MTKDYALYVVIEGGFQLVGEFDDLASAKVAAPASGYRIEENVLGGSTVVETVE